MRRKVQRTPTGTYFITLPKEWVESNNIKQGDVINMEIRRDGALILQPPLLISKGKEDRIIVKYSKGEINIIKDIIMSAYLLGYNIIDVMSAGTPIDPKDREEIRRFVHFFMGLEILEESENRIIIHSILDPFYTDPNKLIRRMAYLVEDMLKDGFKALVNNDEKLANLVSQKDQEVNRVYFLLIRLLRGALRNPVLADKYMLRPFDYLDYRVMAKILESIGDIMATIKNYMAKKGGKNKKLEELLNSITQIYRLSIDLFFQRKTALRREFNRLVTHTTYLIEEVKREYGELIELIKNILRDIIDIADLVVLLPENRLH